MFRVYIKQCYSPRVRHCDILDCVGVENTTMYGCRSNAAYIRCHCAAGNIVEYVGDYEIVRVEEVDHAETNK